MATYTSNLCKNGTPIASYSVSSHPPAHAFDGNTQNLWYGNERGDNVNGKSWIGYHFLKRCNISKVHYCVGTNYVSSIKLEYSSDGATWTTKEVFSNIPTNYNTDSSGWVTCICVNKLQTRYDYWRILANSGSFAPGSYGMLWNIYELEMYEDLSSSGGSSIIGWVD